MTETLLRTPAAGEPAPSGGGSPLLPSDAAELARLQQVRRRAAVEKARRSPYWRGRLAAVDAERADEPEEWAKIPILTKEELRALSLEAFYSQFCIAGRQDISEFWRSGGSTGRPLFYPRTHEDLSHAMVGFQRVYAATGVGEGDLVHISFPLGIHPVGQMCARAAERQGAAVMWVGAGNAAPSAMQIELMHHFRPSVWVGMSSYALHLANLARAEGLRLADLGIRKVICSAEPLSKAKRAKLQDLWGATVYDSIGMTEMMMMGSETEQQDGFRIWSDLVYPEVVDPDSGTAVDEGEEGLLVVTSLATNNATPFLRWSTGDIVTLRREPDISAFGNFPVLRHTRRTTGFFKVRGVNIGHAEFEDFMFAMTSVADFRVEVAAREGTDAFTLHVECADGAADDGSIAAAVRTTFELTPEIVRREHGAIARDFEGSIKADRFRDLR